MKRALRFLLGLAVTFTIMQKVQADENADLAEFLVAKSGIRSGVCAVLGCGDGKLSLNIVRSSNFLTHTIDPGASAVAIARNTVDVDDLYGKRVVVERLALDPLPYADNTIDLVIADTSAARLDEISAAEIARVLRPDGKALIGGAAGADQDKRALKKWLKGAENSATAVIDDAGLWAEITKKEPKGIDDWTHWNHAPDNNPLSSDSVIKAPYMTQWMDGPLYIAMPAITTAAGGRTFTAMGNIAHHEREEPWLQTLLARNGYNGRELWRRSLPEGVMAHRSAYIATDDVFYLIDGDRCLTLDPETGEETGEIRIGGVSGEWKWMAMQDGVLYALTGDKWDDEKRHAPKAKFSHWSWGNLSKGFYEEQVPWGFGQTIAAYDLKKGQTLWTHTGENIDSRAMAVGKKDLFYYEPGIRIGCLALKDGKPRWENTDKETMHLIDYRPKGGREAGDADEKLTSTPGFRSSCYSIATPEALVFAAETHLHVVAVSAETGEMIWHHKKTTSNPNTLYVDGRLLVGIGAPQGETYALDPKSGEVLEKLGFQKRSCARLTGCPDALFVRGPEGLLRYDRGSKTATIDAAVRPACNDGALPANGLLYLGPWLCDCNLQLMGTVVYCPANGFDFASDAGDAGRIEYGDGYARESAPLDVSENDWPTYRADIAHSASSKSAVPEAAAKRWEFDPLSSNMPVEPTAAGGLVFLAGDDGKVRAVDAKSGDLRWCYAASGPVKVAPTVWNGLAYFGSGDGYIYALEAATGRLAWRFRAAPVERRIMMYGSLCSTWPVNSGVLVQDGVAYAAAGAIDYDGTYVYALDAMTGKIVWQNATSGHLNATTRKGVSAQGRMTIANGKLWLAGGHLVAAGVYDLKTGECLSATPGDWARGTTNRGEEIFALNDRFTVAGGKVLFSGPEKIIRPDSFTLIEASEAGGQTARNTLMGGIVPPAWDGRTFATVDGLDTPIIACEFSDVISFIEKKYPLKQDEQPQVAWNTTLSGGGLGGRSKPDDAGIPPQRWNAAKLGKSDTVSIALASNAVVAVGAFGQKGKAEPVWKVSAFDSASGQTLWQQPLPSEALPGGLLIDREGNVVVVLRDGKALCFGAE